MTDFNTFSGTSGNLYTPNSDERTFAILSHVLAIFFGFIPPLIIWLVKKDESKYVEKHAKESLNFQITMVLAYVAAGILVCIFIGIILLWVVYILNIVLCIIATIQASDNKIYRYPFCIRLIK
jgi:hypothetical protein